MSTSVATEIKFCQSCIERGFNPPNQASREWQPGIYYCDDCFNAIIANLTNVSEAEVKTVLNGTIEAGPILDQVYKYYGIPEALQYDKIDVLQRSRDKLFNLHAPSVVNKSIEELQKEIEELGMIIFHCIYRKEPLELEVNRLKEQRRKEKNLTSYDDSKEVYSKVKKPSNIKTTQEEKMAKTLGMTLEQYKLMVATAQVEEKKAKERKFNILAGNCPECGGHYPCAQHPNEKLI
jgi:hypothetical protein